MSNSKFKKFACVVLAVVTTVSGLQVQSKKIQASTELETDIEVETDKRATAFCVEQAGEKSIWEGTVPESTDVKVTNVLFDDDSTEDFVSDYSLITVSLEDGNVYKVGENTLNVSYMGYTQKVTVYAETDQVVSISAEQSNSTICSGDTLSKGDFEVVAYYSSGKIDSNYIDYEIVDATVTDATKSVTLRTSSGIETVVDLTITVLEPERLAVSYNGAAVNEGAEVDKDNFVVVLIYNNGRESVLEQDAYDLVYDEIVGNCFNSIEVVYKLNPDISETVYVIGVSEIEIESPLPTTTPDDSIPDKETAEPDAGLDSTEASDYGTESTGVPESTASVPVTSEPVDDTTNVPVATEPVPTMQLENTTSVPATTEPVITESPSETPSQTTTVDNDNLTSGDVTTGSSVTSTTAIPVNTDAPSDDTALKNSKTSLTLGVGEKVKVTMSGATTVTYQTSNSKILTVTSKGKVTAKKVGKAQIIITDEIGNTKTYTITVRKAPKKVKVNFTKKTMKKAKKATIKVSFAAGSYSRTRTFKSSNRKIAAVNSKGVITAKKKGTCKITVKTFNGKKAVIKITVK